MMYFIFAMIAVIALTLVAMILGFAVIFVQSLRMIQLLPDNEPAYRGES